MPQNTENKLYMEKSIGEIIREICEGKMLKWEKRNSALTSWSKEESYKWIRICVYGGKLEEGHRHER